MARGTDRDNPRVPWTMQWLRRTLERLGFTPGSGGGAWGTITGTLSDQTDLQAALDGKADVGATGPGIMLFRGTSTASIANVEVDLAWADPAIDTTSGAFLKTSATTLRCVTAGTWKITVQVRSTSDNRSELQVQALRNESAEANDLANNFAALDTDQDTGGVSLTYVVTLAANDTLRFVATSNADGAASLLAAGTSLFVEGPY